MTFDALYGAQLNIELASADTTQLFTMTRRKKAVNDAQLAFARQTGCTKRYRTIAIVDGTGEYDLDALFTDFLRLEGAPSIKIVAASGAVTYIQGADDFPKRDPEWLDWSEPGWRASDPGTPSSWYERVDSGAHYLGLNPAPDVTAGDTWTLLVPYVARPVTLAGDTDVPFTIGTNPLSALDIYHQGLVHFAAAQLEPLRKNYPGAQAQMQKYASYAADYITQERKGGPDQVMVMRSYFGETMRGSGTRPSDPRR